MPSLPSHIHASIRDLAKDEGFEEALATCPMAIVVHVRRGGCVSASSLSYPSRLGCKQARAAKTGRVGLRGEHGRANSIFRPRLFA